MPRLKCHCQCEFDVSREDEVVECPECGRGYKNPFYSASADGASANTQQSISESDKPGMSLNVRTDTPLSIVHGLSKSWLMLVLAITVTVTAVFAIVDLIPHLKGFLIYANLIKILLYVFLCSGVWMIFINNRTNKRSVTGYKLVKSYITTIYVFIMIIAILVLIVVFLLFGAASKVAGEAQIGDSGMTLNTVLILAILVLVGVISVMSTFFSSINGVLTSAQKVMKDYPVTRSQSWLAAIILIIIGVVKLAVLCATNAVMGILDRVFEEASALEGIGVVIGKVLGGVSLKMNWSSILLEICGMLNYILGGVLLIIYSKKMNSVVDNRIDKTIM